MFGIGVEGLLSFSEECTPIVTNSIHTTVEVIYSSISIRNERRVTSISHQMLRFIILNQLQYIFINNLT